MRETIMLILGWGLGWVTGLFSPIITDWLKKPSQARALMRAIKSEAKETRYRLALCAYILKTNYDDPDKEFLRWAIKKLEEYEGPENKANVEALKKMEKLEGQAFEALWLTTKAQSGRGSYLKMFPTSFLESNLHLIGNLPAEFQSRLHAFRNKLFALNEQIAGAKKRHEMTFDSSISKHNHKIILDEIISEYKNISNQCRFTVEHLDKIIAFKEPSLLNRN